jgi:hypothetical protein
MFKFLCCDGFLFALHLVDALEKGIGIGDLGLVCEIDPCLAITDAHDEVILIEA